MFNFNKETNWNNLDDGIARKILSYNDEMMMVRVRFKKGSVGVAHQHKHTQSTFVIKGKFEFRIGNENKVIEAGDTCLIPANVLHGCVCLEEGELLDIFTPLREDFL
ncbi:cupin domain-containing protein [Olivibacter sp. CPCC 100613]|uniref:cupin domain-containing protein n=1 Tax=Olivibacter sp. CPCC 100613 TaxID=3079931 RepID=UPI002FFBDF54